LLPVDTEGVRRTYTNQDGGQVYCSVVLAGRDVTSIHRPELCLPGQGWKIESEQTESVPVATAPGGALQVMRMNTTHVLESSPGGSGQRPKHVFAYWFVGKERTTARHWQRILWTSQDRVFHNRNHRWAYILLHASVAPDASGKGETQSPEETMQLLARFVRDIYPELQPQ
jgi:EpsI family protein